MDAQILFNDRHLSLMKRALSAYALRHRVVSDNLANVDTQGYRAQNVEFETALERAGQGLRLHGNRTHPGHLPLGEPPVPAEAEIEAVEDGFDNGVNDVNVDREMAELAKNDLAFRLATRLLSRRYQGLNTAISGEVR